MGTQRLSRAIMGTQWQSPVVVEPYLAKEIARGVVDLECLILCVGVVEDFETEGVPDEGGNQRRPSERHSSGIQDLETGGVHAVEVHSQSREADEGGNQRRRTRGRGPLPIEGS